jgi:hypothetical protein
MNETEDMKRKRKRSFDILTVGFKWGSLNFDFGLTTV